MDIREYDPARDRDQLFKIWAETSEWDRKDSEKCAALEAFYAAGRTYAAEIHGAVECTVLDCPGTLRYLGKDLPFSGVMSVDAGFPARRQGLARRVTAHSVAQDRADGALVSGLGMFDQGFYNALGFGSGPYENLVSFNPANLRVPVKARPPHRLTPADAAAMHQNRLDRDRRHGAVSFPQVDVTRLPLTARANGFALGYFDGPGGSLSHHIFMWSDTPEHGPYLIGWMVWRTRAELLELLALLHALSDQIRSIKMWEPEEVQLQDFLDRPIATRHITWGSAMAQRFEALAHWQMRMNDVVGCLVQTELPWCPGLRFNLRLDDPIGRYLAGAWRGETGTYVVDLGPQCFAEPGEDTQAPTLEASLNAFTRMWLGALPASSLAVSDALSGPDELVGALDDAFRLPKPAPGWDY